MRVTCLIIILGHVQLVLYYNSGFSLMSRLDQFAILKFVTYFNHVVFCLSRGYATYQTLCENINFVLKPLEETGTTLVMIVRGC